LKDMCWKKPKDGKSHFGTANFSKVLLNDEKATMQQPNKLCKDENVFSYTRIPIKRMCVKVVLSGIMQTPKTTGEGT